MKTKFENLASDPNGWKHLNMTSFHGHTFRATVDELVELVGEPNYVDNSGTDKTTHEWIIMNNETGTAFTIYDWKEYRTIRKDEKIDWHIGAHRSLDASAGERLLRQLKSDNIWYVDVPV